MILRGTLINLKYVTWDQTVPNQEQDKQITGRAALRMVLGYVVLLLVDAATFLILLPQTLSSGICKTIVFFQKILLQDHFVSLLLVQLLMSNWRLTWVNSFIPSSEAKISLILSWKSSWVQFGRDTSSHRWINCLPACAQPCARERDVLW